MFGKGALSQRGALFLYVGQPPDGRLFVALSTTVRERRDGGCSPILPICFARKLRSLQHVVLCLTT
jgi:hypothetical protein